MQSRHAAQGGYATFRSGRCQVDPSTPRRQSRPIHPSTAVRADRSDPGTSQEPDLAASGSASQVVRPGSHCLYPLRAPSTTAMISTGSTNNTPITMMRITHSLPLNIVPSAVA